jgi:hypothetical protein
VWEGTYLGSSFLKQAWTQLSEHPQTHGPGWLSHVDEHTSTWFGLVDTRASSPGHLPWPPFCSPRMIYMHLHMLALNLIAGGTDPPYVVSILSSYFIQSSEHSNDTVAAGNPFNAEISQITSPYFTRWMCITMYLLIPYNYFIQR